MPPAAVLEQELRFNPQTGIQMGMRSGDLASQERHLGRGLLPRCARLQTAKELQPARKAVARPEEEVDGRRRDLPHHHDRYVNVWRPAGYRAVELWRRDSHHRVRVGVETYGLSHQTRVGPEASLPQSVTEHDHRMRAGGLVFLREEATAQGRPHAQHGEIVPRDNQPLNALGLPAVAERQRALESGDETFEELVAVTIVDEVSEAGGRADALAPAGADHDEPVRFSDRQLPDQGLVNQAEDRRIGADANGQ
jgi:hypothetical protein